MIHSFSAADPNDPATIAGRWLANGAFVYFGSMNEPFLQSFRPPALVAALIAEGVPLGAAIRRSPPEPFGQPWRLVYLGDPLYRLQPGRSPAAAARRRGPRWPPGPPTSKSGSPTPRRPSRSRLNWALKAAIYRLQHPARPQRQVDLPAVLLGDRPRSARRPTPADPRRPPDRHPPPGATARPARCSTGSRGSPPSERSPVVRRTLESLQMATLQRHVAARDFTRAAVVWSEVLDAEPDPALPANLASRASPPWPTRPPAASTGAHGSGRQGAGSTIARRWSRSSRRRSRTSSNNSPTASK